MTLLYYFPYLPDPPSHLEVIPLSPSRRLISVRTTDKSTSRATFVSEAYVSNFVETSVFVFRLFLTKLTVHVCLHSKSGVLSYSRGSLSLRLGTFHMDTGTSYHDPVWRVQRLVTWQSLLYLQKVLSVTFTPTSGCKVICLLV